MEYIAKGRQVSCNEMPIGFVFANPAARSFQKVVLSIHYSFKYSDLSLLMQAEGFYPKFLSSSKKKSHTNVF